MEGLLVMEQIRQKLGISFQDLEWALKQNTIEGLHRALRKRWKYWMSGFFRTETVVGIRLWIAGAHRTDCHWRCGYLQTAILP